MRSFEIESRVRIRPEELWDIVVTPAGVNAEFRPFLRMTFPPEVGSLADTWRPNETLFRSWILLFGILPVEYDDLTFVEVDVGHRFLERSQMFTQRVWQHEREILPDGDGARIIDRLTVESRIPMLEPIQVPIFRLVFRYRHARIRKLYGRA